MYLTILDRHSASLFRASLTRLRLILHFCYPPFSIKCVVLKQRPFKCDYPLCDWAFGERSNLNRHIKAVQYVSFPRGMNPPCLWISDAI
jgi:hypothetical protein